MASAHTAPTYDIPGFPTMEATGSVQAMLTCSCPGVSALTTYPTPCPCDQCAQISTMCLSHLTPIWAIPCTVLWTQVTNLCGLHMGEPTWDPLNFAPKIHKGPYCQPTCPYDQYGISMGPVWGSCPHGPQNYPKWVIWAVPYGPYALGRARDGSYSCIALKNLQL